MKRELIDKPLIMEDADVKLKNTELSTVQGSNVFKGTGQAVAEMKQGPESIEDGIEHKEEEMPSEIQRKRAPKNKFKSDSFIRESKSLLRKNAMHEKASDEDKAWLASLSDVEVGSNVFKGTGQAVAEMKQGPESIEDGIEHKEEEMPSEIQRKRAPKNKFKSDSFMRESKSLLRKNAMHEEASDEDKAWLASLSDVEVDLLVSIKQMAMERAKTIQDERVNGIFGFKVLRTIGLLLKELIKERLKSVHFLGNAHEVPNILLGKHASHVSLGEGESNHIREQDIVEAALEDKTVGKKKQKRDVLGDYMESELKKQKMAGDGTSVETLNS